MSFMKSMQRRNALRRRFAITDAWLKIQIMFYGCSSNNLMFLLILLYNEAGITKVVYF